MKKIVSLILCVLFALGAFTVLASAEGETYYKIETNVEHGVLNCYVNGKLADCAKGGDVVVIEAVPEDGYYIDETSVKYGYGSGYSVAKDAAGFYSFEMPDFDIVVTATFKDKLDPKEVLNEVKPIGSSLLNVVKSLLPLIKAFFGDVVDLFKTVFQSAKIELPF